MQGQIFSNTNQRFQYEGFMSIVCKYKTTIPKIMEELSKHGKIRRFDFSDLAEEAETYVKEDLPNIFK